MLWRTQCPVTQKSKNIVHSFKSLLYFCSCYCWVHFCFWFVHIISCKQDPKHDLHTPLLHVALPDNTFHCIIRWITWDSPIVSRFLNVPSWIDWFCSRLNFHTQSWQMQWLKKKNMFFNSVWNFIIWPITAVHLNMKKLSWICQVKFAWRFILFRRSDNT